MKKLLLLILLSSIYTSSNAQIKEVYVAGCAYKNISRVNYETGEILWQRSAPSPEDCNDIELTKKGVLYAYQGGARLVKESGEIVWDYKADKGAEVYTATKIKKGYLVAMCGIDNSSIVLLNKRGEEIKEIKFNTGASGVHVQLRQIIPTDNNTFLVPVMGTGELLEIDMDGEVIKRIKVGGNPFGVSKTNTKGEYMVSCGDAGKIVFVDLEAEKVIREINNADIKGDVKMLFVGEITMLKNDNIVVANWNGHSKDKTQAKIFELDPQNRVVSTLGDNKDIKNISGFDIIK